MTVHHGRAPLFLVVLRCVSVFLACLCLNSHSFAAELKSNTIAAFDEYVAASEARMQTELRPGGNFLYVDSLPPNARLAAYQQLRAGDVYIARLKTTVNGKSIPVPDGMIHHWVGLAFIPDSSMEQVLKVAKDYRLRTVIYKPDVMAAREISHYGNDYKIFLRLYQKKFTTVVLNTEYDIRWGKVDPNRVYSNSYSTRIAEVRDPNNPDGPEYPVGEGHGYLWRLYTYWRFEAKDGGVYMQCEAISLTRDIPTGLGWLLRPLVTSIPKHALDHVLRQTRQAVVGLGSQRQSS